MTVLIIIPPFIDLIACGVVIWPGVRFLEHILGIQKFSNTWSLGPLGILKILPVGYSYQGYGSLVSYSLRYYQCLMHMTICLPPMPLDTSC